MMGAGGPGVLAQRALAARQGAPQAPGLPAYGRDMGQAQTGLQGLLSRSAGPAYGSDGMDRTGMDTGGQMVRSQEQRSMLQPVDRPVDRPGMLRQEGYRNLDQGGAMGPMGGAMDRLATLRAGGGMAGTSMAAPGMGPQSPPMARMLPRAGMGRMPVRRSGRRMARGGMR